MKLKTKEYIATAMWVIGGSLFLTGMILSFPLNFKFLLLSDILITIGLPLFAGGLWWCMDINFQYVAEDAKKVNEAYAQATKLTLDDVRKISGILSKMSDEDVKRLLDIFNKSKTMSG